MVRAEAIVISFTWQSQEPRTIVMGETSVAPTGYSRWEEMNASTQQEHKGFSLYLVGDCEHRNLSLSAHSKNKKLNSLLMILNL